MKKYISILSLITVLIMQSCERSDSDLNVPEQKEVKIDVPRNIEFSRIENEVLGENDSDNLDTGNGDDDDPPRDKQHWRAVQDTIGKF